MEHGGRLPANCALTVYYLPVYPPYSDSNYGLRGFLVWLMFNSSQGCLAVHGPIRILISSDKHTSSPAPKQSFVGPLTVIHHASRSSSPDSSKVFIRSDP
jgi:hypothetical protein